MSTRKLAVGDMVRCIESFASRSDMKGKEGIVCAIDSKYGPQSEIGVSFKGWTEGHDCDGAATAIYGATSGRWGEESSLELIGATVTTTKTTTKTKTMATATTTKKSATATKAPPGGYLKVGSTYVEPEMLDVLKACIATSQPALLVGETGTGKTSIVRELATEQSQDLIRVSLNGTTGIEEILGKWLAKDGSTVWQDGILVTAMKDGKWIIFDEINAALPEVLFVLHSLLDDDRKVLITEKDNEVVYPHDNFRFFASMNPPEDYAGTKDVNRALLSRFQAILKVSVMPNDVESQIIIDQSGVGDAEATQLVQLAQMLRDSKENGDIFYFCSTRDLIHAGRLVKAGCSLSIGVQYSIVHKMDKDEVKTVEKALGAIVALKPSQVRTITTMLKEIDELQVDVRKSRADAEKYQNHAAVFEQTAAQQSQRADVAERTVIALTKKLDKYSVELAQKIMATVDGALAKETTPAVPAVPAVTA